MLTTDVSYVTVYPKWNSTKPECIYTQTCKQTGEWREKKNKKRQLSSLKGLKQRTLLNIEMWLHPCSSTINISDSPYKHIHTWNCKAPKTMYTYLNIVTSRMLSGSLLRNIDNLDWKECNRINIKWIAKNTELEK